jgi:3,4-dihydroxy 2-butanone 4-phosphate synthase/GTP cyclohydrolase II
MIENKFNTIEEALRDIAEGRMIIVADDQNRENEGDLVCAADKVTPELINFMATHGRGLICLSMDDQLIKNVELDSMVSRNTDEFQTAFTISIDADPKFGVTTGISAPDRAKTIQVAIADDARPSDLRKPGHIFPLKAQSGGVLKRVGHTEASVDLARLAGCKNAGVICEILNDDGSMARQADLFEFAHKHDLKFITIADLVAYRLKEERFVHRVIKIDLPSKFSEEFEIYGYQDGISGQEHIALVLGDVEEISNQGAEVLVRMHSACLTDGLFESLHCNYNDKLRTSLDAIRENGAGVLVYLRQEAHGTSLLNELKAYENKGSNTIEAKSQLGFPVDLRNFGVGAQILNDLGLKKIKVLTNNPKKIYGLDGYGLEIVERVPLKSNTDNDQYLQTKKNHLGHIL